MSILQKSHPNLSTQLKSPNISPNHIQKGINPNLSFQERERAYYLKRQEIFSESKPIASKKIPKIRQKAKLKHEIFRNLDSTLLDESEDDRVFLKVKIVIFVAPDLSQELTWELILFDITNWPLVFFRQLASLKFLWPIPFPTDTR